MTRVEGVEEDRFTQVFQTKRRHTVRMDFRVLVSDPPGTGGEASGHRAWEQEVSGTPFERVLDQAITEVLIDPAHGGTAQVTIASVQKLRGYSRTGTLVMRQATNKRLDRGARRPRATLRLTRQERPFIAPWSTTGPGVFGLFCVSSVSSSSL